MIPPPLEFPGGKRFAFTIIDDTDVATLANVAPVYRLLEGLGLKATKTVWAMPCPEGSRNFGSSETLQDPAYRAFAVDLQRRGFEIAFHGATMESSDRERTAAALECFRRVFGAYPRVHANHSGNRDNLYWGTTRIDHPGLRLGYRVVHGAAAGGSLGHVDGSPYWWGDLSARHVHYVRNLTFGGLNVLRFNPSLPYHDPTRPYVRWWFSATDAEDVGEFVELFTAAALDRLERERGVCILATHLAKGYAANGSVRADARACFEDLARRPGWFPTVGDLLDWLRARRGSQELPRAEWRRMQWRWARDMLIRRLRRRVRLSRADRA